MASPARLRLSRPNRITQGRDFAKIKVAGKRLNAGCVAINYLVLEPGATSRLGVITSRKIGNAVVRARARRLLRESFRLHQHHFLRPAELVLVARISIAGKCFAEVEKDFLQGLSRAGLLKSA
jgi:ribonuclease P protein component